MARIMLVEDDHSLACGLTAVLQAEGHAVDHSETGEEALELIELEPYSLLILDIGLPGISGFETLKRLRGRGVTIPILILTARDAGGDKVRGLDIGADDYMLKPFDTAELAARVRALLRRRSGELVSELVVGRLVCDMTTNAARLSGQSLDLRRREWAVLVALARRAGTVVPKERLIAEVFAYDDAVGPNALEVYITRLRKKLADGGPNIRALRGLGYLMEA